MPRTDRATASPLPGRAGGLLLAGVVVGCGPGLHMMHESNLRFEHCYRLDMDPKIAPSHREHCWRDWTETYAYGQVLDRIEYARRRIVALESGSGELMTIHSSGPEPERVFAEVGATPDSPIAALAPTSVTAPPPRIEPAAPPGSGTPVQGAPPRDLPGAGSPGAPATR